MPLMESPPGPETILDGRRYLYFSGTGYLGLQADPEVHQAAAEALARYGLASATSRTGLGTTPPLLEAERQAAAFFQSQSAFYFATGYVGNHILTQALEGAFDAVFLDELSHYCLFEAARLAGRPVVAFRHRDAGDLSELLRAKLRRGERPLVMTDGVFAGLGHLAPLGSYVSVLKDYPGSTLLIDDAHGVGVLGANGRGSFEYAGLGEGVNVDLADDVPASAGPRLFFSATLSKALGGFGGVLPISQGLLDRIRTTSHYYEGASAPPVPVAAATARALELARTRPELRARLAENVRLLKTGLLRLGLSVEDTPVPVVALSLGTAENMQRIHQALADRGIMVPYLSTYSGLGPFGGLRLAVFATHTAAMIERLLENLAGAL
jgi:8-amino-7-oxononanoate synthase